MLRTFLIATSFVLFLASHFKCVAQQPVYEWAHSIGTCTAGNSSGNAVKADAAGNVYIAGFYSGVIDVDPNATTFNLTSYQQTQDFFLCKYSPTGNLMWAKTIGHAYSENCNSMTIDNAGNILVTGTFSGTVDFDPGPATVNITSTGPDVFFAKYDSNGNCLWAKALNSPFYNSAFSVSADQNNNVFLSGKFVGNIDFDPSLATASYNSLQVAGFLAKYDVNGNYLWVNVLNTSVESTCRSVKCDNAGSVYVAGDYIGITDFDPSPATFSFNATNSHEFYIAKYNSAGNFLWAKALTGGATTNQMKALTLDGNRNIIVTGAFNVTTDFDPGPAVFNITDSPTSSSDIFIAKYDSLGNFLWAKDIGSNGINEGRSVVTDALDNIYATGVFSGLVTDFDASTATAIVNSNSGTEDIFILKYDAAGNYVWAGGMGSAYNGDRGNSIDVNAAGKLFYTGVFLDTADFDISPAPLILKSNNCVSLNSSFFLSISNMSNGSLTKAFCSGTIKISEDMGNCIKKDNAGNIYVCGSFAGSTDFDLSPSSSFYLPINGGRDGFVAKYSPTGVLIWARQLGSQSIASCRAMVLDNFGGVIVTGDFSGTCNFDFPSTTQTVSSSGFSDVFVVRYDNTGAFLWKQCFGSSNGNDIGTCITRDSSNRIYVAGIFNGSIDLDPGPSALSYNTYGDLDIFMSKFQQNGTFITGTAAGSTGQESVNAIAVDNYNRILLVGRYDGIIDFDPSFSTIVGLSPIGNVDGFITKYESSLLMPMSAKRIGGNSGFDEVKGLVVDNNNNYIVTGGFQYTANFNTTLSPPAINLTANGAGLDIFVAKYDSTINHIWAKRIDGNNSDFVNSLVLDHNYNIFITGSFSGTLNFLTAGVPNITSNGGSNILITKFDPNGTCIWGAQAGGNQFDKGNSIVVDNNDNVYATGFFGGIADFDPASPIANLYSAGEEDIFILKYKECATTNLSVSQSTVSCFGLNNGNASVTATGGSGFSYLWNPGGFTTSIINNLGAGSYSCVVTNSCGYTNTITANITQPSSLILNTSPITNTVCIGNQVNLSANLTGGIGPYTYTWSNGSNTSFNNFTPTSSSLITLIAADVNNCSKSSTLNITVVNNPTVTLNSSTTTICVGGSVTLSASGANTYFWNPTSAITSSMVVFPPGTLIYSVTGSDANNCSDTKSVFISVLPLPNISVLSSSSILCIGNSAVLNASGASTYTWDTGSNNTSITVTPTVNTTYTVIGASGFGCLNTVLYTQNVSICTDLEKENLNKNVTISIYPNPNNGQFYISEFENNIGKDVEVYNSLGQLVKQLKIESAIQQININDHPKGFYYIRISNGNSVLSTIKIIKD